MAIDFNVVTDGSGNETLTIGGSDEHRASEASRG
jgi:hypothetical protein